MNKSKIFIGSSTEGLDIAYAIQQNLDQDAEVTIWVQGIFQLSTPIITTLINQLSVFDYAIFVFSPDDLLKMRNVEYETIRDNIIFETGLFAGKLGIERVFFIKPRGQQQIHLPTDLLGLVAGEYESRTDNNLVAATAVFCNQVRQSIRRLGKFDHQIENDSRKIYENDLKVLISYMQDKDWTMMSFDKIKANVHSKLTEEYLMKLIDIFPETIRRSKIKGGADGIKLLFIKD